MPGPRLESILGHCERHALLHMAPKWFDHWTTWAGLVAGTENVCCHCSDDRQRTVDGGRRAAHGHGG